MVIINTVFFYLFKLLSRENLESVDIRLVNVTHHYIIKKSTVEIMLSTLNR